MGIDRYGGPAKYRSVVVDVRISGCRTALLIANNGKNARLKY